jgi:hypothetical protein
MLSILINSIPKLRATTLALTLAVPLGCASPAAQAQDGSSFAERCQQLAAQAKIQVLFEDKAVSRDDSRSLDELKRLSQTGAAATAASNPYHRVLGLTHAAPSSRLELSSRALSDADGRVCAVPSLTLTLGFSELKVYLARETTDDCRRRIIDAHEAEHVAAWRNHLRIGARLLTNVLQKQLTQPMLFDKGVDVSPIMQQRVEDVVDFQLARLMGGIGAAHGQIDSPANYQLEENRLRACP